MSEEIVAHKHRRGVYAFSAVTAWVAGALFIVAGVFFLSVDAWLGVLCFVFAAVMEGMAFYETRRALRVRAQPQELIVYAGEKLHIFAKEGKEEVRPREIALVEEKPLHSHWRVFTYGELRLTFRDGLSLTVENVDSLAGVKQRLVELKALDEIGRGGADT